MPPTRAVSGEEVYYCPVCNRPFDRADKLFDLALASHEKSHAPQRNNPANMIQYDDESLTWCCKLCGDSLHIGEFTARQKVITHCREKHGGMPASSTPDMARGGGGGTRSGFGGRLADIAEDIGDALGGAIGRLLND